MSGDRTPLQARIEAATMVAPRPVHQVAPAFAAMALASAPQRVAREARLADHVRAAMAAAAPPPVCGPEIPAAPARGAFQVWTPTQVKPGTAGTLEPAGYRAPGEAAFRKAIRVADIWDVMEEQARRDHSRRHPGQPFQPPFTQGQIAIARRYRDLFERHEGGGVRCASLETRTAARPGGGGGGEFIDAFVAEGLELARLRARIGPGASLMVRRVRPSRRGRPAASVITDRALVQMVCVGQAALSEVLEAHGWSVQSPPRRMLRQALAACLDRMQGLRGPGAQNGG